MEVEFEKALRNAVKECKELKPPYNPIRFIRMLDEHGAVKTAKMLLANHDGWQEGFGTLLMRGRLDLTLEEHVVDKRFRLLFSDEEIAEASRRLKKKNKSVE